MVPFDEKHQRFFEQPYLANLATVNRDGSPQVTPLWYEYRDGQIIMTTVHTRLKVRNIRRDNRVSLSISSPPPDHRRVLIQGRATVSEEDVVAVTRRIAARYVGAERLEERMGYLFAEPRVLLIITPERFSSNL